MDIQQQVSKLTAYYKFEYNKDLSKPLNSAKPGSYGSIISSSSSYVVDAVVEEDTLDSLLRAERRLYFPTFTDNVMTYPYEKSLLIQTPIVLPALKEASNVDSLSIEMWFKFVTPPSSMYYLLAEC